MLGLFQELSGSSLLYFPVSWNNSEQIRFITSCSQLGSILFHEPVKGFSLFLELIKFITFLFYSYCPHTKNSIGLINTISFTGKSSKKTEDQKWKRKLKGSVEDSIFKERTLVILALSSSFWGNVSRRRYRRNANGRKEGERRRGSCRGWRWRRRGRWGALTRGWCGCASDEAGMGYRWC